MPYDLHMEHLNRTIKNMIKCMGGNVSPEAIVKAGKALGLHTMCVQCLNSRR